MSHIYFMEVSCFFRYPMKMKSGDLVKRHRLITCGDQINLLNALNEIEKINRQINFIWAFATNRNLKPPIQCVSIPFHEPGLLIDIECKDFINWVKNSRDDHHNKLHIPLVRVLWDGEIIVTLLKWIETVERSEGFRRGEL